MSLGSFVVTRNLIRAASGSLLATLVTGADELDEFHDEDLDTEEDAA